jgi:hypothetical protein
MTEVQPRRSNRSSRKRRNQLSPQKPARKPRNYNDDKTYFEKARTFDDIPSNPTHDRVFALLERKVIELSGSPIVTKMARDEITFVAGIVAGMMKTAPGVLKDPVSEGLLALKSIQSRKTFLKHQGLQSLTLTRADLEQCL